MNKAEHLQRHTELHEALDELVADMITETETMRPSNTTVMELMEWSASQIRNPSDRLGQYANN